MRLPPLLLMAALVIWTSGCSDLRQTPEAPAAGPGAPWTSGHFRQHVLAGRIWDTRRAAFTTAPAMVASLAEAPFVLLGEKHDNPDHHRLQAWILQSLVERGRRPTVAFEMLDTGQEAGLADFLAANPTDAAGLGPAVGWDKTGWPAWSTYQPIAPAALDGGLTIVPASLPRQQFRTVATQGVEALPAAQIAALGLDRPIPGDNDGPMREEIIESHCHQLPDAMVDPMVLVQKIKDIQMAVALIDGAARKGADGAVLIAGNGHVRADRGVPWPLERRAPGRAVATVGMIEVVEDVTDPADYAEGIAADRLPFDYVWFTPRVDIEDPCEKFAEQFRHICSRKAAEESKE